MVEWYEEDPCDETCGLECPHYAPPSWDELRGWTMEEIAAERRAFLCANGLPQLDPHMKCGEGVQSA